MSASGNKSHNSLTIIPIHSDESINSSLKTRDYLSVDQLAKHLGVSPKTIYGWVYRGVITPERVGPRLIRFDIEKVEQWIALQNAKE